ncbi:hypothetical protein GV829_06900 [Sphingomonas lacunae]|uniref:Uncharacterized protein n=1 Tax=Sphingomonas lacunae TaxID=2698828 RepID=A0A6M4AT46_9SPHN|nr:hypothetical protein [Sphingomonas lacunae]QJQ32215.1 hypothetical protein GV829_06900 [Sphingomonas lacunae]
MTARWGHAMIDIVVDGKRINWAGKKAKTFYEKAGKGLVVPSEPSGFGPPVVAAQLSKADSLEPVRRAAHQLQRSIAQMHGPLMALADDMAIIFTTGARLRGDQIKSLWQHGRFVVNDHIYATSRGGATIASERLSHIRHDTVSGYAKHEPGGLEFIILHEFMHMTEAGIAVFADEFAAYAKASGDQPGKRYDDGSIHFRRTEQFVNAAARELMRAAGLKLPLQTKSEPPDSYSKDNMPPYGYEMEAIH